MRVRFAWRFRHLRCRRIARVAWVTRYETSVDHALYRRGDAESNRVLLLALWARWGKRCYICGFVGDLSHFHIEHMIPRDMGKADVKKNVEKYGSATVQALDFNVDAPHNLAPACSKCNLEKSNRDLTAAGYLMQALDKACAWEADVRRRVAAFRKTDAVTQSMLSMLVADLTDSASKSALLSLGPVVVDRLRMVAPQTLAGESSYPFDDPYADEYDQVTVTLDERGRRAAVIVEDLHGSDFDEFLQIAVRAVRVAVSDALKSDIESQLKDQGHYEPVVGEPNGRSHIAVVEVLFDAADDLFRVRGSYEADGAASAVVVGTHGDSADVTEYADPVSGDFIVELWFDDTEDVFEANDAELV